MEAALVAVRLDNIDFLERYEIVYTGHNQTSSLCLCLCMPPVPQCDKSQSQLYVPLHCPSRCILIHNLCSFKIYGKAK